MDLYQVVSDFQAGSARVLILDRSHVLSRQTRIRIDGVDYPYAINAVENWVIIQSDQSFAGKTAQFV